MDNPQNYAPAIVAHNLPYAKLGFWRIGGAIEYLHTIHSIDQLQLLLQEHGSPNILGNGSNMLVADEGISGHSVILKGQFTEFDCNLDMQCLILGAGLKNVVVLNRLKRQQCFGISALAGVPGTIGGALRMNAGSVLGEISESVLWVEWLDQQGILHRSTQEECSFSYRHAAGLPPSAIILRAAFRVYLDGFTEEQARITHHLGRRKATQPLHLPSCGSVFKNPSGDYAGRLIDAVGLKGHIIGGASISDKHANFIVNNGGASAMDVFSLISLAQERVQDSFGISLEPEVRLKGDWPSHCHLFGAS
jgi:UDP-N-acetylmuramate dehydrogenase